jgi:hypothetical protein
MAQWNKNEQDYLNQERTLHEVYKVLHPNLLLERFLRFH